MERLSSLATNADGYAFDPFTGECFQLNKTGQLIISWILKGLKINDIATKLSSEHLLFQTVT